MQQLPTDDPCDDVSTTDLTKWTTKKPKDTNEQTLSKTQAPTQDSSRST